MVWLRAARPGEETAIRAVHCAAFGQPDEADIVDRLRADGALLLSHLADRKQEIIAHVAFSPAQVLDEAGAPRSIPGGLWALAPMAVLPAYQRQRIGEGLLRSALLRVVDAGVGAVVVLGHPAYYPRFGFAPASRVGLRCPIDVPDDAFLLRVLREELPPAAFRGTVRWADAFGIPS